MEKQQQDSSSKNPKKENFKGDYLKNPIGVVKFYKRCCEFEKGRLADLRRTSSPEEVFACSLFFSFLRETQDTDKLDIKGLAVLLGCLARIKENNGKNFFATLGGSAEGEKPKLSEHRFNRLMRAKTHDEFYRHLFRVLALLKNEVNIDQLGEFIMHKSHQLQHPDYMDKNHKKSFFFRLSAYYYGYTQELQKTDNLTP